MKRIILMLLLLAGATAPSHAQSWADRLMGLFGFGSSSKQEVVAKSNYISASELAATWVYQKPVIDYTGSDPIATMAVGTLEGNLDTIAAKGGLQSGRDRITFKRNGTMEFEIDAIKGQGSYTYDPSTGEISLTVSLKDMTVTMSGVTEYASGVLTLKFDAGKALNTLKGVAPSLAENDYVKIASSVVDSYPGIRIGAAFQK